MAFRYLTIERPPWRFVASRVPSSPGWPSSWRAGGWVCSSPGAAVAGASGIAGSLVAVLLAVYVLSNVILFGACSDQDRRSYGRSEPL